MTWRDDAPPLRHYQQDAVEWMSKRGSYGLFDEMRLGKTMTLLRDWHNVRQTQPGARLLIVAPNNVILNAWLPEVQKWTTYGAEVATGTALQRQNAIEAGAPVTIIAYDNIAKELQRLQDQRFYYGGFDEAHAIKGWKTQRTKAAMSLRLAKKGLVTATPMLNRVDELWPMLAMISPRDFGTYWQFVNKFCNTPDAPIWMGDGSFKPIGEIQVGDVVMGWTEGASHRRRLVHSVVERVERRLAPEVIKATLESGRFVKCTPDHVWLSGNHNPDHMWVRIRGDKPHRKATLSFVVDPLGDPTPEQAKAAGWIGGMYDGEGSRYSIAQSLSYNPEVHAAIGERLKVLGIPYSNFDDRVSFLGGRSTWVKLLNWSDPVKRDWLEGRLLTQLNRTRDRVVHVEDLGPGEVVSMQTTSGNYVAWGYASRNCVFGGYENKQIIGIQNVARLKALMEPHCLRRKRADVMADMPPPVPIDIMVDLLPPQRKMYDDAVADLRIEIEKQIVSEFDNPLTRTLRLRQIIGTPACFGAPDDSAILDAATDHLLGSDPDRKTVIFSQFLDVLAAMGNRLDALDIGWHRIQGEGMTARRRADEITAWNHDSSRVMLASYGVGREGVDLSAADLGICLDLQWVPALQLQAESRMVNVERRQIPEIIRFHARKTVSTRVLRILSEKQANFDTIVEVDEFVKALVSTYTLSELLDD